MVVTMQRMRVAAVAVPLAAAMLLSACGGAAQLPVEAGTGANPELPAPQRRLIPLVNIAPARGWAEGARPHAMPGVQVVAFAQGLQHPRWLCALPNGDVLVAETDAPPKPDDTRGLRGWIQKRVMRSAGSGLPSANRITLLRDTDGDGVADQRSVLLQGLNSPFGMTLVGEVLYVADTDAVLRFPFHVGETRIDSPGERLVELPAGTINHHWTKNLIANADGSKLYVTVGSNSNVAENGMEAEAGRAAIWEVDTYSGSHRLYATGLRNPNGLAWEPHTGALWAVVNERDELGSDLVPDYMTAVRDGAFYGWPYSYYGQHVDARVQPPRPDLVVTAVAPDYALGAHTASLGLAWSAGAHLPGLGEGMFVGQHGSWNRKPRSGYKLVFVPFADGRPSAAPVDVLDGFVDADGRAQGRPVGVAVDAKGGVLVADDVGDTVWRLSAAQPIAAAPH